MIKITLSTKLGELRWSQADLARATGIRPNTISELYNDLCERVNLDYIDRIRQRSPLYPPVSQQRRPAVRIFQKQGIFFNPNL